MSVQFLVALILCALAGQVLSFEIPFGASTISAKDILSIPPGPVTQACSANCTIAQGMLAECADDTACLCRAETVALVRQCEMCMLHFLIEKNIPPPDPRAGSNVLMGGYAKGCMDANFTVDPSQAALTLPDFWDGPFVAVLPTGGVVVTVIIGTILGAGSLFLLCNM